MLDASFNKDDRVLNQLMAMKKLLGQKEPELALVGLVTAIEWFLNERFPAVAYQGRSGRKISASIAKLVKSGLLSFLSEQEKENLIKIARLRNEIVHGAPPGRNRSNQDYSRHEASYVSEALEIGLSVYRKVNLHFGASGSQSQKSAQQGAPADPKNAARFSAG